ncbi:MAG: RnfABCDGE type electron transport complex subunit G [Candidatus Omnitrophica bacterium]|nr:RnfABCDGE type electron transport complex subunit G [Candidatus Omnitrophota bacterium]
MKLPENIKYIVILALICFATASLLSLVYLVTKPDILAQKEKAEQKALEEVIPGAGYFQPVKLDGNLLYFRAYASTDKKRLLGYAFKAQAQGYSSVIESMAGMDVKGKITGIRVLAHNETPGLGAKIDEVLVTETLWQAIKKRFSSEKKQTKKNAEPWFCAQFKGKKTEDLIVVTGKSDKNIQAITGATISSEALTDSVRQKAREVLEHVSR